MTRNCGVTVTTVIGWGTFSGPPCRLPVHARALLVAAAVSALPPRPDERPAIPTSALDELGTRALFRLGVPGAAMAVLHGGRVIYEHTWGVAAPPGPPVTPKTLFMIGSCTKPMTTLMQAALVDAGRLRWTTPLKELLPRFALAGDQRELLLWHASCACSGVPGDDFETLFEHARMTADDLVASARFVRPTAAIGERYQYSNLMMAVSGYAAARASEPDRELGDAYIRAMQRHVFEPIGMAETTFDEAVVVARDHARPHAVDARGVVQELPLAYERSVVPIRPAGGVWTNLRDLERYALTELARGVAPNGRRVVSPENVEERWKLRVRESADDGYGLGLGLHRSHGRRVVSHSGGSHGFGSTMVLLPDDDVAIVILTNVRNGTPNEPLPFNAVMVEAVLDGQTGRGAALLDELARALTVTTAVDFAPDPAWLRGIAGHYRAPRLGDVRIGLDGVFDAGEWRTHVGRRGESVVFLDPPFAGAAIVVHPNGFDVSEGETVHRFARVE